MSNDDEALEEVFEEIRRDQKLKDKVIRASQHQDFEAVARIVNDVLISINRRTVDNFVNFVNEIMNWFSNL